ncbi:MAG: peptidylprolyl isomerase [Vicingaceae bacterium]
MKTLFILSLTLVFASKSIKAQSEVTFYTSKGDFVVETYDTLQPITAGNFLDLVNKKFYDGIIFHRVISSFVIQGGDPTGTGFGGPGYSIQDEFNPKTSNTKKTLSMANSGPNTGGSQFFINLVDNTYLDPNHPVFGEVVSNFSVVEDIGLVSTNANNRPLVDVTMDSVRVTLSVGLNESKTYPLNVSVFPNPAEDYFSIKLDDKTTYSKNYKLRLTNLLGQIVYTENFTGENTRVDVSDIAAKGIYFVNILDNQSQRQVMKKIVLN